MGEANPPDEVQSHHDGAPPSTGTPFMATAQHNQPFVLAKEPSFPAGNASPIVAAANMLDRAASPFPAY